MNEVFYEIFNNLPRQAPGDVMITLECFQKICTLNKPLKVVDIGCGSGFQTLFLALNSEFFITGVDNHQSYLDELQEKAISLGLGNRIKTLNKDMSDLDFKQGEFDIVMSEGAIYIIEVEKGLNEWKKFIKKDEYLIFSDVCWVKQATEGELTEFWATEYPTMMAHEEMKLLIAKCGYKLVYDKLLPANAWLNNYYYPLSINVIKTREKYKGNSRALEIVESVQREIDIFYKYHQYYTYGFFVCQI
jgi:ubiquinone/menaquinone biosynthesis C-methylase UbiE